MFDNANGRVAVDGTATLIASGAGNGVAMAIKNTHESETLYVGGDDVTAADGYPVGPGGEFGTPADDGDDLYGITGGAEVEVAVLRQGV